MAVRLLVRVLVVVACVAVAVLSLIARDSRIAEERVIVGYLGRDDPRDVLRAVDDAEPLNPDHFLVLIRARLEPARAQAILQPAIRREPDNVELWLLLVELERRAGDDEAARRAYARARELVPTLPPKPPPLDR